MHVALCVEALKQDRYAPSRLTRRAGEHEPPVESPDEQVEERENQDA